MEETKAKTASKPAKSAKKFVNPVLSWCIIAVEIAAALLIGFLLCR
ncbi:MAG: hypothetical protein IKI50_02265 [Clostridia bacterium]|nr:hypothetical protein [Clostridia bacterium]